MAVRAEPVSRWPGAVAAALVAALILGTLAAVAVQAEAGRGIGPSDLAALRFTLLQAALSALISVGLAVPVARALARRRFAGRRALIALMGAPFILPVIVAILGLLQVFGRSGWISDLLGLAGLPPVQIYGLHGVVLAHVFFNLPLATRLILQGWQEVPAERFRLAAQMGCEGRALFHLIEAPMLRQVLPGALAVVFAICLTSFAVALTLGGGPRATTIELAIYQAFTYDFDLGRAALLSGLQLALTACAAFAALRLSRGGALGGGLDRAVQRWDGAGVFARLTDALWVLLAGLFLLMPLAAVVLSGLAGIVDLPGPVVRAALISVLVSLGSTLVLLGLALPMAATIGTRTYGTGAQGSGARGGAARNLVELAGILGLAASPLVIGTGLFVMIRPMADPSALALPVTALVNAVMALPFALRILVPAARQTIAQHGRLALSLGMGRRAFFMRILLPGMRPQIGFAAGLTAALSLGDLGVIALFADPQLATLPLQIYRLMGAYQMESAAGAALLLLILSMAAFWALDRGGKWHAEA